MLSVTALSRFRLANPSLVRCWRCRSKSAKLESCSLYSKRMASPAEANRTQQRLKYQCFKEMERLEDRLQGLKIELKRCAALVGIQLFLMSSSAGVAQPLQSAK